MKRRAQWCARLLLCRLATTAKWQAAGIYRSLILILEFNISLLEQNKTRCHHSHTNK